MMKKFMNVPSAHNSSLKRSGLLMKNHPDLQLDNNSLLLVLICLGYSGKTYCGR